MFKCLYKAYIAKNEICTVLKMGRHYGIINYTRGHKVSGSWCKVLPTTQDLYDIQRVLKWNLDTDMIITASYADSFKLFNMEWIDDTGLDGDDFIEDKFYDTDHMQPVGEKMIITNQRFDRSGNVIQWTAKFIEADLSDTEEINIEENSDSTVTKKPFQYYDLKRRQITKNFDRVFFCN